MFKKILLLLAFSFFSLHATTQELKYNINLNTKFKGVLLFQTKNEVTDVKYFNISSRDKIPFYAPKKEFTLTTLNNKPTLNTLKVLDESKRILYDLTTLSPDEIEDADIYKGDLKTTAIIYNKEGYPSVTLEKKLIHTIESLMLSIFETKEIPKKEFYLYEPHKKMLIKVKFTSQKRENISFDNLNCSAKTDVLEIVGRDRKLIRVYSNPYPIKIESYRKKWSFVLNGYGEKQEIKLTYKDIAFKVFKDEILKLYKNYNLKILSQEKSSNTDEYITRFHLTTPLSSDKLENALTQYTSHNNKLSYTQANKDSFKYSVKQSEVLDLFKDHYETDGDDKYWLVQKKKISYAPLKKVMAQEKQCKVNSMRRNTIICNGENESVDFKDALHLYYKKKGKEFQLNDIQVNENTFGEVKNISYTVKTLEPITESSLQPFAVKALQKKYTKNNFSNTIKFFHDSDEWSIYISKIAVKNYACKDAIPKVTSKYKDGECQVTASSKHTQADAEDAMNRYVTKNYPDLKILQTDVKNTEEGMIFNYLKNTPKVYNECN